MSGNDRSSSNPTDDIDSKLRQYMLINKQISRTLTAQRVEIANLKNSLRAFEVEEINLRRECHKWKNKYDEIIKVYISHIDSLSSELQTNAVTINRLQDDYLADSCKFSLDRTVASPKSVPRNANDSRRISKSFESSKNRSQRRNDESLNTIEEEDEISVEVSAQLVDSSAESLNDTTINGSKVTTDEDSSDSLGEVLKSGRTSEESSEESQVSDEEISKIDEGKDMRDEVSGAGAEEIGQSEDESGKSEEESSGSEEENAGSDAEDAGSDAEDAGSDAEDAGSDAEDAGSDAENAGSDAENTGSDEENAGSDEENAGSDAENTGSDEENAGSDEENVVSRNEDDEHSDTTDDSNDSDSVEQITILTANDDSATTKDDESDKDDTANSSIYTQSISQSTKSVITLDSETFNKSTPAKPLKKLPANKKKSNMQDKSMSMTYGSMEEQSLVSSTPYRSSSASSDASVQSNQSSKPRATSSMTSESSVASSRPRRKAAPVVLSEPKLNTKLRRPR